MRPQPPFRGPCGWRGPVPARAGRGRAARSPCHGRSVSWPLPVQDADRRRFDGRTFRLAWALVLARAGLAFQDMAGLSRHSAWAIVAYWRAWSCDEPRVAQSGERKLWVPSQPCGDQRGFCGLVRTIAGRCNDDASDDCQHPVITGNHPSTGPAIRSPSSRS